MNQPLPHPVTAPRTVSILGSTGSIGKSSVKLLELHRNAFQVVALTANENVELLAQQAKQLNAKRAVIANEALYHELKAALAGTTIEAAAGQQAVIEAAALPSDVLIAAIVGAAGLLPTLTAIQRGATIALANKECLVCAGDLMMKAVMHANATILPVDSEHSAIFQVFDFNQHQTVEKIILTASGGPFRTFSTEQMRSVTPEQAVKHPNWDMGAKISIDSATMMNKGLELIEAYHLFPVDHSQIDILIHPESIIHSMVSYIDGSVLAQLGTPDMCTPIAYALSWPKRMTSPSDKLDFTTLKSLHFETPDTTRFPSLNLCKSALQEGGVFPTALNAANEVAVARFLRKEIGFLDIVRIIDTTLLKTQNRAIQTLEDVLTVDTHTRQLAESIQ